MLCSQPLNKFDFDVVFCDVYTNIPIHIIHQYTNKKLPDKTKIKERFSLSGGPKGGVLTAYIGLTLMTIIIGFAFIFIKYALQSAGALDVLAHRFLMAALAILLYYTLVRRKKPNFKREHLHSFFMMALFYSILLFSFQTIGLKYTTASEAGILTATAPVITLILAGVILKEKSNIWQIISVLLSMFGVLYILYKTGLGAVSKESLKGDFYILLSVVSMAFYFIVGRRLNRKVDSMDITFFMTITAAIFFNIVAFIMHLKGGTVASYFAPYRESSFLWSVIYLGVLSTFLTSFLTNNALRYIPASQVAIFNNLSPVVAVFAGVLLLGEHLYTYHFIGGFMVLLGIVGVNMLKNRQEIPK